MPPYAGLSGEGTKKKLVFYFCSPNRGLERMGVVTRLSFFLLGQNIVTSELRYETRLEKRLHYKGV